MSTRSYRPRHRRPSKVKPALAVTTMSTAITLAGASSTHAATSDDFARLRHCESGGNYAINTGNNYYGAYQFDERTWRGLGYDGLPSNAAPATQDEAARRLQLQRGWGAWPACSRQLGLRRSGASRSSEAAPPAPAAAPRASLSAAATPAQPRAVSVPEAPPIDVLPVGTVLTPPPPPVQPFAIDISGTPREDVRMWQEQMAKRGWDITVDGFHGEESARVAAAFIETKGIVEVPGHTLTEILWNATWETPVA